MFYSQSRDAQIIATPGSASTLEPLPITGLLRPPKKPLDPKSDTYDRSSPMSSLLAPDTYT